MMTGAIPAGLCQTCIGRDEYMQITAGVVIRDDGPIYHRVIEIDATDKQVEALRQYLRAHGVHGVIRKPATEATDVDE